MTTAAREINITVVCPQPDMLNVLNKIRQWHLDNPFGNSSVRHVAGTKELKEALLSARQCPEKSILVPLGYSKSDVVDRLNDELLRKLEIIIRPPRLGLKPEIDELPNASLLEDCRIVNVQDPLPALRKSILRLRFRDRICVRELKSEDDFRQYFSLRYRVWRQKGYLSSDQDCPESQWELNFTDRTAYPAGVFGRDGTLIACARLVFPLLGKDSHHLPLIEQLVRATGDPKLAAIIKYPECLMRKALMWSEYALCYDKVLNSSLIYPALINTLIGHHNPGPAPIPGGTIVLDLGAGTGNLTYLLAERSAGRLVISIDNNAVMLNVLRQKCEPFLREDTEGPGVIATKQDVGSLYGLNDGFFDYVVLNNVLYSLEPEAAKACLKEAHRVLKPGGELRFSEPKKGNKLSKVLDQIGRDLKSTNRYAELEKEYNKVRQINEFALAPLLHRWSLEEIQETLRREIGFTEITYATDNVYAGQSMLVCAQK